MTRKKREGESPGPCAACVQTFPINSSYYWKNELCREREILLVLKTRADLYDALEQKIKELHPYETPEIVAVDIEKGFQGYLEWIDSVTRRK